MTVRPIPFCRQCFMGNGVLNRCALFALVILCVQTASSSPAPAQQPQPTREGIITTFAPVVEKVAPSVVTVFTTETVSRGQAAFCFPTMHCGSSSVAALGKEKANRRCKALDRV